MSARNFFYDAVKYDIIICDSENCADVSNDDLIF